MERAEELFEKVKKQGEKAINEFIDTRQSEELFLDFKRSSDDGKGSRLHDKDRNNLSKAISGFGNSEGGIILWGVDCSKDFDGSDVAKAKYTIQNVKRFMSWVEGVISGCTVPPHNGVQNHPVDIDSEGNGFVVTYIPKSDYAPHQEIPSRRYYIRAGSSFVPTPHDVLAGMFGKRPQPKIKVKISFQSIGKASPDGIHIVYAFDIGNEGRGLAKNLFANILIPSPGGSKCKCSLQVVSPTFQHFGVENSMSVMPEPEKLLPPGGWFGIARMTVYFLPPFKTLEIRATIGCGNAPPVKLIFGNEGKEVNNWYEQMRKLLEMPEYKVTAEKATNKLLGIRTNIAYGER